MAEDKEINNEEATETKADKPEVELPVVPLFGKWAVSYTHLTLPTNREV